MFKKLASILFILTALMAVLLPWGLAEEGDLTIALPEGLTPFREQAVTLNIPFEGELTVQIDDGINGPFTILKGQPVQAGAFSFYFNGLVEGGLPLKKGKYTLHAQLLYDDQFTSTSKDVSVSAEETALYYAIPSSKILNQGETNWFIDWALNDKSTLVVDVYFNNQRVHSIAEKTKGAGTGQLFWNGTVNGAYVPEGSYECKVYLKEHPTLVHSFPVDILSALPPLYALEETGSLKLENLDGQDLITALSSPLTVLTDEGATYPIVETSDKSSERLGTFYPNVQGLDILSLSQDEQMAYVGAYRREDGAYIKGYVPKAKLKIISPSSDYGLVIDKNTQLLTVYHQGSPLGSLSVSTGLMKKSHLEYETPAGAFIINQKGLEEKQGKNFSEYVLFMGEELYISQMDYSLSKKQADYTLALSSLGTKATTGHIGADIHLPSSGSAINAYWLWANIPPQTKVLIIDDRQNREDRIKEIYPKNFDEHIYTPTTQVITTPLAAPNEGLEAFKQVLLTFGGDCVLGGEEKSRKDPRSFDSVIAEKGYGWPFSGMVDLFVQDDMTIMNLEGVLQNHKKGMVSNKIHIFRGATDYTEVLRLGSVEQVNIANNHYIDYGNTGKESTKEALTLAGISYSGFEHLHIFEKDGHKIGFSGIRETVYKQDKSIMESDILKLKEAGCDVIVYACHFGKEYDRNHNQLQTTMAHRAIDLGANIVIGHHTHVVQGIEGYNGGVIFYGLGNFVFGGNLDLTEFDGLVVQTNLLFQNNQYQGVQVTLHPVLSTGAMPANDFRPIPAVGEDRVRILQKVQNDSLFAISDQMYFPAQRE